MNLKCSKFCSRHHTNKSPFSYIWVVMNCFCVKLGIRCLFVKNRWYTFHFLFVLSALSGQWAAHFHIALQLEMSIAGGCCSVAKYKCRDATWQKMNAEGTDVNALFGLVCCFSSSRKRWRASAMNPNSSLEIQTETFCFILVWNNATRPPQECEMHDA